MLIARVIGTTKYNTPAIIGSAALTIVSTLLNDVAAFGSATTTLGVVCRLSGYRDENSLSS